MWFASGSGTVAPAIAPPEPLCSRSEVVLALWNPQRACHAPILRRLILTPTARPEPRRESAPTGSRVAGMGQSRRARDCDVAEGAPAESGQPRRDHPATQRKPA